MIESDWCGDRDGDVEKRSAYTGSPLHRIFSANRLSIQNHETSYCGWSEQTPAAPQEVRSGEGTTVLGVVRLDRHACVSWCVRRLLPGRSCTVRNDYDNQTRRRVTIGSSRSQIKNKKKKELDQTDS